MWRIFFTAFLLLTCSTAFADETEQIKKLQETINKQNAAGNEKLNQEYLKLQNDLDSADPQLRAGAISKILHSNDRRLVPVIRSLLQHPSASTKKEAVMALHRLRVEGVGAEVGKLVADSDPDVQHTAAEYGAHLGYKSTLAEVKQFLQVKDFGSQSIAMHLSQTLSPAEATPVLGAFLRHESHHLRKRAVWGLMKYDDQWIQPYATDILKLAGDSDGWVQQAVLQDEKKLQGLLKPADLRRLTDDKSAQVRAIALRMLDQKGEDIYRELAANLTAADPVLRETALNSFRAKGQGPEKEIIALLDDPDRRVKSTAVSAMSELRFPSAVPKLQKIFREAERYDRQYAAKALLKMDEPLWPAMEPPPVKGGLFATAAKVAYGDKDAWPTLLKETNTLVGNLTELKDFPCDRSKQILAKDLTRHPVNTRGPRDDHTGGKLGSHTVARTSDQVLVVHGNLVVNGYMTSSLVIVTGDFYIHDGYIYDSIVLVQGRIIAGGYLNNSIVFAGSNETLTIDNGYIWGSVAAAGTIDCSGYYKKSILGGKLVSDSSGHTDLRETSRFDATAIYQLLRGVNVKQNE